jgi:hypothetical protein
MMKNSAITIKNRRKPTITKCHGRKRNITKLTTHLHL